MPNKLQLPLVITAVLFALLFLWLRENEGRIAAETKLEKMRLKYQSQSVHKAGAITDLQAALDDRELKLEEAARRYDSLLVQKNDEILRIQTDAQAQAQKYEAAVVEGNLRISDLEQQQRNETARYNASLKEKNTQMSALAKQLEQKSSELSALFKQKESLEASLLDAQSRLVLLQNEIAKWKRLNAELEKVQTERQSQPITLD